MAKDSLKELKQNRINQGFWLTYDNQAKAKKETSLMDKMAAEIRVKDEEKAQERQRQLQEPQYSSGVIKVWKDWRNSYYHN